MRILHICASLAKGCTADTRTPLQYYINMSEHQMQPIAPMPDRRLLQGKSCHLFPTFLSLTPCLLHSEGQFTAQPSQQATMQPEWLADRDLEKAAYSDPGHRENGCCNGCLNMRNGWPWWVLNLMHKVTHHLN